MQIETQRGLKEAAQAVGAAIGVGAALALGWRYVVWPLIVSLGLAGCATQGYVFTKYEHHSSIPDYHDAHTADLLSPLCLHVDLVPEAKWQPQMEGCVNFEVPHRENPFGRNPSGELSIRLPIPGASW